MFFGLFVPVPHMHTTYCWDSYSRVLAMHCWIMDTLPAAWAPSVSHKYSTLLHFIRTRLDFGLRDFCTPVDCSVSPIESTSNIIFFWPVFVFRFIAAIYVLHKQLESVILIGLPVYTFLLLTMCWRSIARASDPKVSTMQFASQGFTANGMSFICWLFVQYSMQWLPTFSAMGSVLFVISDSLIAFDRFHAPIAYSSVSQRAIQDMFLRWINTHFIVADFDNVDLLCCTICYNAEHRSTAIDWNTWKSRNIHNVQRWSQRI